MIFYLVDYKLCGLFPSYLEGEWDIKTIIDINDWFKDIIIERKVCGHDECAKYLNYIFQLTKEKIYLMYKLYNAGEEI